MEKESKALTKSHYELIMSLKNGADVMGYAEAKACREIQQIEPSFIDITRVMGEYSAIGRLPYFGAIATPKGVKAARSFLSSDTKIAYL